MATETRTVETDLDFEVQGRILAETVVGCVNYEFQDAFRATGSHLLIDYKWHRDTDYTYGFSIRSRRKPSKPLIDQIGTFIRGALAMHRAAN